MVCSTCPKNYMPKNYMPIFTKNKYCNSNSEDQEAVLDFLLLLVFEVLASVVAFLLFVPQVLMLCPNSLHLLHLIELCLFPFLDSFGPLFLCLRGLPANRLMKGGDMRGRSKEGH